METILKHEAQSETHELGKYTRSFGLSFGITSLFSALLLIIKETNQSTVLAWMKAATGHHWVTHGVLNLVVFFFFGWLLARSNNGEGVNITARSLITCIVVSLVVSWMIIAGFYVIE
jgi:hypothetical protein